MARVLYAIGTLIVIGFALWLFDVLRAIGPLQTNLEYQLNARVAAIPLSGMLGGVLIIAFGVALARLKAIQIAGELSGDALAEIAGRDRGRAMTGSSPGPFHPPADNVSSRTKSAVEREARTASPSAKANDGKPSADNATPADQTKSPVGGEASAAAPRDTKIDVKP